VLEVVVARDVADLGRPDYTLEDVESEWSEPGFALDEDAWVAEQDGRLVAYACVRWIEQLVLVAPAATGAGTGSRLLELVEGRARERGLALRQHLPERNAQAAALLSAHGYTRRHGYLRLGVELDPPPPQPRWPAGTSLRRYAGSQDDRPLHALFTEAFSEVLGSEPQPFESWRAQVVEHAAFDPDLLLVAELDGAPVGAAACERWDEQGAVRSLATVGRGRGIGLGRALLLEAFAEFRRRGLPEVVLGVQSDNVPALGLYESVGMRTLWRVDRWQRDQPG
jgi:mycothiol synthase